MVVCAQHAEEPGPPGYRPPPPPSNAKMLAAVATARAAGLPAIKTKGAVHAMSLPALLWLFQSRAASWLVMWWMSNP